MQCRIGSLRLRQRQWQKVTKASLLVGNHASYPIAACSFSSAVRCATTTTTTTTSPSNYSNNSTCPSSKHRPRIDKVLIANRGEIACRVIRTCQRFGIPTVALYSVADGPDALHAQMADEAFLIGDGPTPAESYLRQDAILEICRQTNATAVHPGYGFLSENASFAQRLTAAGHVFIGPPASAIQAMGSKSESKAIMEAAGVRTTPAYYEVIGTRSNNTNSEVNSDSKRATQDAALLRHKAHEMGYPVLIKAVSGGGGKGMRLVWNDQEFLSMLESCQREAWASFGDDHVLLEKYLVRPRHVEVQIVADQHGNVVSLHERDCSLQRRHQKIIEEAPASDLPHDIRQELGAMGRKAAQAVGYVNAGTVEFLLDTQNPGNFYFCEMNTRLQVEHPITEEITGIDLVEWQLRVAAGESLPITDSRDIPSIGHAFEARIYAENPARNFLPATGHVWHHVPPAPPNAGASSSSSSSSSLWSFVDTANQNHQSNCRVRVDTCIQAGLDVSVYYDPMISKLIVHADDRPTALQGLVQALKQYQIAGVPSNIDFLIQCAQHPVFGQAGAVNTGFLEDFADDVQILEHSTTASSAPLARAVATLATLLHLERRRFSFDMSSGTAVRDKSKSNKSPWSSHQGSWRMGGEAGRATRAFRMLQEDHRNISSDSSDHIQCISNRDGSFEMVVGDKVFHLSGEFVTDTRMHVIVNHTKRLQVTTALKEDKGAIHVYMWPEYQTTTLVGKGDYMWQVTLQHPFAPSTLEASTANSGSGGGEGHVKAPMPGKISRLQKQVGDAVQEGEVVLVMEAMKMEHAIRASSSGIVTELRYTEGDIVGDGAVLLIVGSEQEQAA